jgi:hypothetical protein
MKNKKDNNHKRTTIANDADSFQIAPMQTGVHRDRHGHFPICKLCKLNCKFYNIPAAAAW